MISGRPFCWLPGPLILKSEAIGVGNKPDTVPSVRGTDGTSRNKQRLDGISFTLKITADGLDDVFLPLAVYRLILSEQRGLTSHVSRLTWLYHREDSTNVLTNNPTGPDLVNGAEHVRPEVTAVLRAPSLAGNGKRLAVMDDHSENGIALVVPDPDVINCSSFVFIFYIFYKTPNESVFVISVFLTRADRDAILRTFVCPASLNDTFPAACFPGDGNRAVENVTCDLGDSKGKLAADGYGSHRIAGIGIAVRRQIAFVQRLFPLGIQCKTLPRKTPVMGVPSEAF